MKASELVEALRGNIDEYGDLEVRNDCGKEISIVEQCVRRDESGSAEEWFEVW